MKKIKVSIIGTNGIPASYGGFETLADNLVEKLANEFDITVYCSKKQNSRNRIKSYKGASLKYLPFNANGFQSIFYDSISIIHSLFTSDVLFVLGPAFGYIILLNLFFRKKIIVNHGGLNEWEREKLSWLQKIYIKNSHKIAARFSTINIADNIELSKSIKRCFSVDSEVVRYGGDHILQDFNEEYLTQCSAKYSFLNDDYLISVSRAQVDNNIHLLIEGYISSGINKKLVIVSNWYVSDYGVKLYEKYKDHNGIILLNAIYDVKELALLRMKSYLYVHTHSRCGTAPSLVEAMFCNIPIICFNVATNVETTHGQSSYFNNSQELSKQLQNLDKAHLIQLAADMNTISSKEYTWEIVCSKYSNLFKSDVKL